MDITNLVFIAAVALLGAAGVFLFLRKPAVSSLAGKEMAKLYRQGQGEKIEELTIVNKLLNDVSFKIAKPSADLETRLRQSGFHYKSVSEFMYRRLINASAYVFFVLLVGYLFFGFGADILTFCAVAAAVWGFRGPDISLSNAIQKRIEKLRLEMGYVIEQFTILLDAGLDPDKALANCEGIGEFGKILGDIAHYYSLTGSAHKAIQMATDGLPTFGELQQYLDLLTTAMIEKRDVTQPLRSLAFSLREKFTNDIKRKSARAKMMAMGVMVLFGAVATLLVILLPLSRLLFGG
jgi:Flp pilus assembly protein TadB